MKKKVTIFLIMFVCACSLYAQNDRGKVFLKNGSVISGQISRADSFNIISVRSSGNIWAFDIEEVEKILMNDTYDDSQYKNYFLLEGGVSAGNTKNNYSAPFSLHLSLNNKRPGKISLGLGIGAEFMNETYMPVFINWNYRFRNTAISPYVFFKIGYNAAIENIKVYSYDINSYGYWTSPVHFQDLYEGEYLKAKGGVLANPGLGVRYMISPEFGLSFSAGYRYSMLRYKGENSYHLDARINRLSIQVGIIFN